VRERLIAAMGEALDDATEYGNARRGYAACALTDVLHAQFELALARFKAGELDYANEVEDVLSKVPEQRRQIPQLEDRSHATRSKLTKSKAPVRLGLPF
jgi:hypothetical protein